MLAWRPVGPDILDHECVFGATEEEALKYAAKYFPKATGVVRAPEFDWHYHYRNFDLPMWNVALDNLPPVKNYQRMWDNRMAKSSVLAAVLEMDAADVLRMQAGAIETTDAVRVALRKLAGPYGKVLATIKLRALGFTVET